MPWKETCAVDQRVALLADWLRDEWTMTELARRYAISRKTAYKWVDRYEAEGAAGLEERSRAATHPGRAIALEVRTAILALRRAHPHWGPRKLAVLLQERAPETAWPAPSTMGDLLRREQAAGLRGFMDGFADVRRLGSAALDLCLVADGTHDAYGERGLNEHDFAAGALIAEEAGCWVRRPRLTSPLAGGPSDDERLAAWTCAGTLELSGKFPL